MYQIPKEIVEGFVSLGYEKEVIEDVSKIDVGFHCKDKISGKSIVTYACYTDEDGGDDVVEFTVDIDTCWITLNGVEEFRSGCTYDISNDDEIAIGDLHVVELD